MLDKKDKLLRKVKLSCILILSVIIIWPYTEFSLPGNIFLTILKIVVAAPIIYYANWRFDLLTEGLGNLSYRNILLSWIIGLVIFSFILFIVLSNFLSSFWNS